MKGAGSKASAAVAAAAKKAAAPKQAAAVTYAEKPDLDALSAGLPPGWKALWDKASKELYYGNPSTKVWAPLPGRLCSIALGRVWHGDALPWAAPLPACCCVLHAVFGAEYRGAGACSGCMSGALRTAAGARSVPGWDGW